MSQQNERRILIVDDSESDRAAYIRYLQAEKNFSYQIIETDTLQAGLESWETHHPDLVLLDINLPDGSGLEFLQTISQSYPDPKLPVIVMTGETDARVALDAIKLGASDYLFKDDTNAAVFRSCVSHTINQLELSRKLARSQQKDALKSQISLHIQTFSKLEDIYQTIVTEVRQFLKTDRVIIYRFNADMTGLIVAESVIPPWEVSLHSQISDTCLQENQGIAYQQGKIFAVSDIYASNLTDCHLQMLERFQVRANLVVPILLPTALGQKNPLWGLLIAHQCSGPRSWETDDLEILQGLSVQLAIALQQSISYEQLQNELAERKRTESTLQKLIAGTSSVAGEAFFPAFVQNMIEILEVPYGLITELVGEQLHTLGFWANGVLQPSISYAAIHTPCEKSLREGQFYCERCVQELFPQDLDLVTMKAEGYLGVALKDHAGKAIGNLCILDTKPIAEHKRVEAIAILKIFAARASAELQRKQADEKLQQLNQYLEAQVEQRTVALQESDLTNRTILEAIPDLLLRLRSDGTCLDYMEPRVERENFLPIVHHISEVLPPDILQNTLRVIERAIATKELQVHEHQLFKYDRLTYEEMRVLAINDQEVLVIVRDISDRKRAEQELMESRQFLQTVLDTFPLSVFWKDCQSVYLGCNQNFARSAGLSSTTEIIEKTDYDLPWGMNEAAFYQADDRQVIESGISKLAIEETITLATGEIRWIETNKIPLQDLDGNVIGVVGTFQDISDRKQAEENLKNERLRLQLALDAAKMGEWSRSSESNHLIWSDRVQEIFGFVPGTFSGNPETFLAMIHPEDRDLVVQALAHAFATGEPYHLEYRIFRLDGEMRWITVWAILTEMLSTDERQLIGMIADISDRKQAEASLQESEERFRRIFYSRVVGMIFADFQGNIIDANDCFLDMIGYTREELETGGIDWLGMTPPEYLTKDYECMEYLIQNGEVEPWEKEYYRKDGSRIAILIGAAFLPGTNNETICVIIDISDRKQAEKSLRESQQFIQTIINTVPLPLFWKNHESVFLGCNQQLAQILGLASPTEIEGKTDFDLSPTEEQAIAYRAGDRRVMESGKAELGTEETHILEDGELNWIETHKAPLRDGDNNVIGVVGMFQNITERKHYELALSQKNTELEELLQLRDETLELREDMSNMIVHDLRTPLTTITLAAGMINKYGDRAGQRALIVRKAGQILDSATQLEKMIDSLLFMAKLGTGSV